MAKRKIKGTTVLPDGTRKIYVFIEKRVGGKRRRFYKTEITDLTRAKDIEDRRCEMRIELKKRLSPKPKVIDSSILFSAYMDKWLLEVCKPRLAPRTFEDYSKYIVDFLVPFLNEHGNFPLKDLTPVRIHDLFVWLKSKDKAWALDKMKRILSSAANNAVRWQLLPSNPVSLIKIERKEPEPKKILSPEDARKFLKKCAESEYGLALRLMLLTGLRPSEAVALRWKDIDLKNNVLSVRQSVTRTNGGGFVFKEPKSKKSIRKITLPETLIQRLQKHKKEQNKMIRYRKKKNYRFTDYDLIFATRFGTPVSANNLNKRDLKKILKKAKLDESLSLYCLRHSIASLLLADGANVKDVQELLGHATPSFTMNRYVHSIPDAKAKLASRFSKIIED